MDKNWLKTMSIYSPKLKEGNTFRTSVWSHLQEKVSPALAKILTIDSNDNLDLMETKEAWRKTFYLGMYRCFQIKETQEAVDATKEVKLKQFGFNNMSAKIPFFWDVINLVDHCGLNSSLDELAYIQLLDSSKTGQVLLKAFQSKPKEMVKDYDSDFISLKVNANNKEELKIIEKTVPTCA